MMTGTSSTKTIGGNIVTEACGSLFTWLVTRAFVDASTLDLPPGAWPHVVKVTSHKTGDVRVYFRRSIRDDVGVYISSSGDELRIFNT